MTHSILSRPAMAIALAAALSAAPSLPRAETFESAMSVLAERVSEALSIRNIGRGSRADIYVRPPFDDAYRVVCPPLSRRLARGVRAELPKAFSRKNLSAARLVQESAIGPGHYMLNVTWRAIGDEAVEVAVEIGDLSGEPVATMGGHTVEIPLVDLRGAERQCLARLDVINRVEVAESPLFVHRSADVFSAEIGLIEAGDRYRLLGRMPYTDGDWAVVKLLDGAPDDPFAETVGFASVPPTPEERAAETRRREAEEEARRREAEETEAKARAEAEAKAAAEAAEAARRERAAAEAARKEAEQKLQEARAAKEAAERAEAERKAAEARAEVERKARAQELKEQEARRAAEAAKRRKAEADARRKRAEEALAAARAAGQSRSSDPSVRRAEQAVTEAEAYVERLEAEKAQLAEDLADSPTVRAEVLRDFEEMISDARDDLEEARDELEEAIDEAASASASLGSGTGTAPGAGAGTGWRGGQSPDQQGGSGGTGLVGTWQCQGQQPYDATTVYQLAFQVQFQANGTYSTGGQVAAYNTAYNQLIGSSMVGEYGTYAFDGTRIDVRPQGGIPATTWVPYQITVQNNTGQSLTMVNYATSGSFACQRIN